MMRGHEICMVLLSAERMPASFRMVCVISNIVSRSDTQQALEKHLLQALGQKELCEQGGRETEFWTIPPFGQRGWCHCTGWQACRGCSCLEDGELPLMAPGTSLLALAPGRIVPPSTLPRGWGEAGMTPGQGVGVASPLSVPLLLHPAR